MLRYRFKLNVLTILRFKTMMSCEARQLPRYLTKLDTTINTSDRLRHSFLEFFQGHDHHYIKPMSIYETREGGSYFTNAGVFQFKDHIETGGNSVKFKNLTKAVNSQRCMRIGGKSCDWSNVGYGPYHLSSFEMLGNWSFGEYNQEIACKLMWTYLTEVLQLPKHHLYVTYFGGCEKLDIPPDDLTRDIWFKLGVKDSKILQFGVDHNFWEMGDRLQNVLCGPSTEIHWDYLATLNPNKSQSNEARCARCFVNSDSPEVVELWNCVFMQYQWKNSKLEKLPKLVVDTGMGLERLASVIQGVSSVYDTDNLASIINKISEESGAPLYKGTMPIISEHTPSARTQVQSSSVDESTLRRDVAYRIVADHMRSVVIAICDGVLPGRQDVASRVRQLVQRSVRQASLHLDWDGGLHQLVDVIIDGLSPHQFNIKQSIRETIKSTIYKEETKYIKSVKPKEKYFQQFIQSRNSQDKITLEECAELSRAVDISFNMIKAMAKDYGYTVEEMKTVPKNPSQANKKHDDSAIIEYLVQCQIPVTDSAAVYNYTYNATNQLYEVKSHSAQVVAVVEKIVSDKPIIGLVLDSTNMYATKGGQPHDVGQITIDGRIFQVTSVDETTSEHVIHWCNLNKSDDAMKLINQLTNKQAELVVDNAHRTQNTINHTAQHLVFGVLYELLGPITSISKNVFVDRATLLFSLQTPSNSSIIEKIDFPLIIEQRCKQYIDAALPIVCRDNCELDEIPGLFKSLKAETKIKRNTGRIVEIDKFKEACCGTHCTNTREIKDIVISSLSQTAQTKIKLTLLAGQLSTAQSRANEHLITSKVLNVLSNPALVSTRQYYLDITNKYRPEFFSSKASSKYMRNLLKYYSDQSSRFKIDVDAVLNRFLQENHRENVNNHLLCHMDVADTHKIVNFVLSHSNEFTKPTIIYDANNILFYSSSNTNEDLLMKIKETMTQYRYECFLPKYRDTMVMNSSSINQFLIMTKIDNDQTDDEFNISKDIDKIVNLIDQFNQTQVAS